MFCCVCLYLSTSPMESNSMWWKYIPQTFHRTKP